jgi:signal transduction histidine kinase
VHRTRSEARTSLKDKQDTHADLPDGGIVGLQRRANEQLLLAGLRAQEQLEDALESQRTHAEDTNVLQRREAELIATAEFRERMLSIIGHDLRNPLNAIVMACSVLTARGDLTERDASLVGRIVSSGQRMTRMISQLVGFTQATLGGDFELVLAASDLGDVCRNIAEELSLSSSVTVNVTTEGDLLGLWDADRLAEVVSNIAGNAVDHATPGTPVLIHCRAEGALVLAEITNLGVCIPAETLPLIFSAFRRGQLSQTPQAGHLGLGLYIASQIAHSHGGTLVVRSSDGSTTFTLRLPRGLAV